MKSIFTCSALFLTYFTLHSAFADLNVLAIGDTGKANDGQYKVANALTRDCQSLNCDFALLLGDNIYDVGIDSPDDPQMIDKFEKPYAQFPAPFYVALGNHDYGKMANDWKKGQHQLDYAKKNPKYILPDFYYSFERDNVLFIVLDTSRLFHNKDTAAQVQFVKDTLKRNSKKWVVIVAHHPYISNGKHGNAGSYDGIPLPPISGVHIKKLIEDTCKQVDLFISGHDHSLQTFFGPAKCSTTTFVVSGSGASTDDLYDKNKSIFQSNVLGFTRLQFTDAKMLVSHVDSNGLTLHQWFVNK